VKYRVALALAALAAAAPLPAQSYFGKNQVQYDRFDWKVIETEHFMVHYYPVEEEAARDAARMAERAYGRLSRIFQHEFREKKPIILFSSRMDFAQNNVTGDLGEGTGGVTDALRHRIIMPFTGDYGSFEQILTHEMVHEFQYDIFARGKAGAGLQTLAQVNPPLWFAEGMAEYLSIGPVDPHAATVMRDAALNGRIPNIEQLTVRPDLFNPYDVGQALWSYIGQRWGDETIGAIMLATPNVGVERAFRRETGKSLEDLGDEWKEAMQVQHLPQIASLQRARTFSAPLLTERRSGGAIFLAPAISDDGEHIAFLSNGSFLRGEVFIDLWLADAKTGKRIKRLVKSTTNPDVEELRIIYSQSSFSPDGKQLAFVGQRKGKDVLYVLDVARKKTVKRIDLPLEGVTGPAWSPDGSQLVFSGNIGGLTDLYLVNVDGSDLRRLTNDRYGDLQPVWSPDGKTIAFASDRGAETDFEMLRISKWMIALYHLGDGRIEVLPGLGGHNLNPQWAPDGRALAYVSSRTGIQNLFLYEFSDQQHYQLTNVVGGITAITPYSPVMSWARRADRLVYTYYENGDYTVWSVDNPRVLKTAPYQDAAPSPAVIAQRATPADTASPDSLRPATGNGGVAGADVSDESPLRQSFYRTATGFRVSGDTPGESERPGGADAVTVAALLDSASLALPDTSRFKTYDYKVRFSPDYIARPSIGYARDNYGRGVFGGTTIILSDLLGNHTMAFAGEVNGRISDARAFAAYSNLSRRLQYTAGLYQEPYFFSQGYSAQPGAAGTAEFSYLYLRYIQRQAYGVGIYPLNRFTRFEFGARLTSLGRSDYIVTQVVDGFGRPLTPLVLDEVIDGPTVNYAQPFAAHVSDNVLFGYTGPIMGRRYRFQVEPTIGDYRFIDYTVDYRRYDPILFNVLTVATRGMAVMSQGRDADSVRKFIGYPEILRGYDRESYRVPAGQCSQSSSQSYRCLPLFGSRVAVLNTELRFPLVRRLDFGIIPISLPPLEGLAFFDAGLAWFSGQDVRLRGDSGNLRDPSVTRSLLRSYGFGVRVNLYGFALLRWDYAIPLDGPNRKDGYWRFSLGPSF
jgi:Tol biopolymer transport system component